MRVPLSWLRDFNDCELPAEDLGDVLTRAGLEIEAIDRIGAFSREVVVAVIIEATDLPERDLRHVRLDIGDGRTADAITAAPNITTDSVGAKVPAALPGALVIDSKADSFAIVEIAAREFLGIESGAVLCSEKELGLSDDHTGVLVLETDAAPGTPIESVTPPAPDAPADIVLEVAILPNYGRCLSIVGMAREVAALTRTGFKLELGAEPLPIQADAFPIAIDCPDLAPRYSGFVLEGAEIRPSPDWLQRRLVLCGLKPYNNLVDVTNYVMLEIGQPMHAFDLDRLPKRNITVRRARPGETMYTLDQSVEEGPDGEREPPRELDESIPLITSGDVPVAIAGVIGGLDSEVETTTKNLLLESANFDFIAIRKAMSKLKVITDAGTRFSRQVDPATTVVAIQRATHLLREIAGAEPKGAIGDCYPSPAARREVDVALANIYRSLGIEIPAAEVVAALERLGFAVETVDEGNIRVAIPGFRPDIEREADVAEEVIRVVGFDRLESKLLDEPLPTQRPNTAWKMRSSIRSALVGCNLHDTLNYSLTTPESEARLLAAEADPPAPPPYVTLVNPSSQERTSMRRTVLGSLLENVALNHRNRARIAMFEIGTVFHPERGDGTLPQETSRVGIVISGPVGDPTWADNEPRDATFFDLKGVVTAMLDRLHVANVAFHPTSNAPYHPGVAAALSVDGQAIGTLGQIHPLVCAAYDLDKRVVFGAELDLDMLWRDVLGEAATSSFRFQPFSRFPTVHQDIALVVDEDVPAQTVADAIRECAGDLLVGIRLFDRYQGEQLGSGKKSLAFQMSFCASDRSLTEDEVNRLRESMLGPLEEKIGAKIR